jgi:protocatechuate 3,4-dioxygenase alpha subunit
MFKHDIAPENVPGERITVCGRVLDADGEPVPDAMIELWQADHKGRYFDSSSPADSDFQGWGRIQTDANGGFRFRTIKPGVVASAGQSLAPHINVTVFMRGLLLHLFTRIYFSGEGANTLDPVLAAVPETRRNTLLANMSLKDAGEYHWDINLQGNDETVFFDW